MHPSPPDGPGVFRLPTSIPTSPDSESAFITARPRNFDGVTNFGPRISDDDIAGINPPDVELEKTCRLYRRKWQQRQQEGGKSGKSKKSCSPSTSQKSNNRSGPDRNDGSDDSDSRKGKSKRKKSSSSSRSSNSNSNSRNRKGGSGDSKSRKGKTKKKQKSSSDSNDGSRRRGGKDKKKNKRCRRRALFDDEEGESVTGMARHEALYATRYSRFLLHFRRCRRKSSRATIMSVSYYHDYYSISLPMSMPNDDSQKSEGNEEDKEAAPMPRKLKKAKQVDGQS